MTRVEGWPRGLRTSDELVTLTTSDGTVCFRWGAPDELGSACFWIEQARQLEPPITYMWGNDLVEETVACLLGGYGVPMLMARAAFEALRAAGLTTTSATVTDADILSVLSTTLSIPGRPGGVRYRFPYQRAGRVSTALRTLHQGIPDELPPRDLRDWLTRLPGVGPKTASFIIRNWTRSDDIAVIDIHIRRAGVAAGVFDRSWRLPHDYRRFEEAFCAWARRGDVGAADLDAYIWEQLSLMGNGARRLFGVRTLAELDRNAH